MKKKGTVEATADIQIREEISAAENFLRLNKLTKNSRKIAPFTSSQQPFVSFSERELAIFFWKEKLLRERLEELARQDHTLITSTTNLDAWISGKEPGYIIKHFICDVAPQVLTSRQRKKAGSCCLWTRLELTWMLSRTSTSIRRNTRNEDMC